MTTVIVGVGFMAMLQLLATGTASNVEGVEHTTGLNLAKNVRELTINKKYDELPGMNGVTFQPVIDGSGLALGGFGEWQQKLTVAKADPNWLALSKAPTSSALRCTAEVTRNGKRVTTMSWFVFDGTP